jgi:hypothetical protein
MPAEELRRAESSMLGRRNGRKRLNDHGYPIMEAKTPHEKGPRLLPNGCKFTNGLNQNGDEAFHSIGLASGLKNKGYLRY